MFSLFSKKKEQPPVTVDQENIHDFIRTESDATQVNENTERTAAFNAYPRLPLAPSPIMGGMYGPPGMYPSQGVYPPVSPYRNAQSESRDNQPVSATIEFKLSEEFNDSDRSETAIAVEIRRIKDRLDSSEQALNTFDYDFSQEQGIVCQ